MRSIYNVCLHGFKVKTIALRIGQLAQLAARNGNMVQKKLWMMQLEIFRISAGKYLQITLAGITHTCCPAQMDSHLGLSAG